MRHHIPVVLANASERLVSRKLFETCLIFQQTIEVFILAKFPSHIPGRAEPFKASLDCIIDRLGEPVHHSSRVESSCAQMAAVGGDDKRAAPRLPHKINTIGD